MFHENSDQDQIDLYLGDPHQLSLDGNLSLLDIGSQYYQSNLEKVSPPYQQNVVEDNHEPGPTRKDSSRRELIRKDSTRKDSTRKDSLIEKIKRASIASSHQRLSQSTAQELSSDSEMKRSSLNSDVIDVNPRLTRCLSQFVGTREASKREVDKGNFSDAIMEDDSCEASEDDSIKLEQNQYYFEEQEEQEEILQQLNSNKSNKKKRSQKKIQEPAKFKTEMCKNWSITGECKYGKKCQFAHGKRELAPVVIRSTNIKYRSKKCKSYILYDVVNLFYEKTCPYGYRCQFMHEQRSMQEIQQGYIYQKIINNPQDDYFGQNFRLNQNSPLEDYLSLGSVTPRCVMRQIKSDPPLKRAKSSEFYQNLFLRMRSETHDKQVLQKWVNQVKKGLIVTILTSSSEEVSTIPNNIYNDSDQMIHDVQLILD